MGNGRGAPSGGTIDIENQYQQVIRTFTVSVQPASGNVPANWVVSINPPMQLGPGMYIVRSSSPSTQANNSLSNGCLWFNPGFQCGFVKIFGSATLPPPPPPHTGGSSGSPTPLAFYPPTQNICTGSAIPAGWIVSNRLTSYFSCVPTYGTPTDNLETIEQYSNAPVGTQLNVCAGDPTPAGWTVVNQITSYFACPVLYGTPANNIVLIKRLK